MKKKMAWSDVFVCIGFFITLLVFVGGCSKSVENSEDSIETLETKLKNAYVSMVKEKYPKNEEVQNMTAESVAFEYYGSSDGKEFFLALTGASTCDEIEVELGDYTLTFGSGTYYPNHFFCLTDEGLFTVKEAYKDGIVTQEDLHELDIVRDDIEKTPKDKNK